MRDQPDSRGKRIRKVYNPYIHQGNAFGIERGRGRAAQNDTFSIYEPWENPNYYSGILKFKSGEKHFRIERNFDKYSKKAELICEEDGEVLSVEDGDLQMLLGRWTQNVTIIPFP